MTTRRRRRTAPYRGGRCTAAFDRSHPETSRGGWASPDRPRPAPPRQGTRTSTPRAGRRVRACRRAGSTCRRSASRVCGRSGPCGDRRRTPRGRKATSAKVSCRIPNIIQLWFSPWTVPVRDRSAIPAGPSRSAIQPCSIPVFPGPYSETNGHRPIEIGTVARQRLASRYLRRERTFHF